MPYTTTASTGSGGGGSTLPPLGYRHRQDTPATTWVIVHGLGFRPAGVLVTDQDGSPVEGVVAHPDPATTTITFGVPVAGTADLS